MKIIAKKSESELRELFQATAFKMGIQPSIIEKDFWVCYLLDHLFNDSQFKNDFVFKGGTSLSKAFHVIERFSEDIDLILDWTKLDYSKMEPWKDRSKNQQDKFNKELNAAAATYFKETLVPKLNEEIEEKLGIVNSFQIDDHDPMLIRFIYPVYFPDATQYLCLIFSLKLVPEGKTVSELRKDYENMKTMIYGEKPDFDDIIEYLKSLENEIHGLATQQ